MNLRWPGVVLLGMALLAGCASTPSATRPSLVLVPPFVSAALSDGTEWARRFGEVAGRAADDSGRYALRTKGFFESGFDEALARTGYSSRAVLGAPQRLALAEALKVQTIGLTDLVPDDSGRLLRIHFRIIDAASGALRETFLFSVPRDEEGWVQTVNQRLVVESPPALRRPKPRLEPSGTWDEGWSFSPPGPEIPALRAEVDAARASGAFDEALRRLDLLLDRTRVPGDPEWGAARERLRKIVLQEGQWAREDNDVQSLLAALASAPGTAGQESRLLVRFLDLVRASVATSEARVRREVVVAFQQRFGLSLAVQLTRPALVVVEGGNFLMGSADEVDEGPVHSVTVGAFLMARTEVTQAQYREVTGASPSLFSQAADASDRPVERVSWYDAVEFCNLLSLKDGWEPVYDIQKRNPVTGYPIKTAEVIAHRSKNGYRLPSEAEWEWAARGGLGGKGTLLAGGDEAALVGWTDGSTEGPGPVATRQPNELGLFDMSGNVWEWCSDWYGKYGSEPQVDPLGAPEGILKVGRGGSWHAAAWNARVTSRSFDNPGSRGNNIGFRVVRSLSRE